MAETIGEYIDRLTTVEMRPGKGNLPRGVIHKLYDAARSRSGVPLVFSMARSLSERVQPTDRVLIFTGAGGPPVLPNAEVDGIPGAVAIARALHFGLGANVTILTEDRARGPVKAAVEASGLNFRDSGDEPVDHCITFEPTPIDKDQGAAHSLDVLDRYAPSAVIGIEKLAPNRVGRIHGATGLDYHDVHTDPAPYFNLASERGILTCGIGDGGNEVGYGVIAEAVRAVMPAGATCLCPCGGGSAATVSTDEFLVAAISDWGGYALAAMIAFITENRRAALDAADVSRMLTATVNAGAFDGATGRPTLSDDGVPIESQIGFVTILNQLVDIGLSDLASPGH